MIHFAAASPLEHPPAPPSMPLATRIAAEYREMPGLSLTVAQGALLWGIDRETCRALLEALVASGRLRCTRERRYCAAGTLERVARSPR